MTEKETESREPAGGNGHSYATRYEVSLIRQLFQEKIGAHETLDNERHEHAKTRIDAVAKSVHDLRDKLAPIFFLPERVADLVRELENVPSKQDLGRVERTIETQFGDLHRVRKEEREEAERRRDRLIKVLAVLIPVISSALFFALTMLFKYLKLL